MSFWANGKCALACANTGIFVISGYSRFRHWEILVHLEAYPGTRTPLLRVMVVKRNNNLKF